ncbi:MAG TPA: hypothetical protein VGQ36_26640 [Thermoanaerobaculia bacterium]|jgi:hypothetical protein|nr:hypothetical protein [Thermoanaerobaculia bacterium]
MKRALWILFLTTTLQAQQNVMQRVSEDAIVFDRVAQASKRDLPRDLLKRIVEEDIDLLRGKRADGTYEHATFERFDSGRINDSFSIQPRAEDKMETVELKGDWVYRVVLEVPTRKMLVRKNQPVWVERVDIDYVGERGTQNERESVEIKQWLQPGEFRPVDLPDVARRATVRIGARTEEKTGYGNLNVSLVKARIVDNADSPYADAVASAKAVQRALENGDVPSIRAMAQRMRSAVGGGAPVVARRVEPAPEAAAASAPKPEIHGELQTIEDLLTGTEQERREGMDRLHQLIRRMRQ